MIKLERGKKPKELTKEVCEELIKLYAEDNDRAVWNSPKIKKPLKEAILEMSHGKCSYCECRLEIESKDATIDHFLPKSKNPELFLSAILDADASPAHQSKLPFLLPEDSKNPDLPLIISLQCLQ